MGSSVGYQDLTVAANNSNGARQQLKRVYGAQQIINIREVNGNSGNESMPATSMIGGLAVIAVGAVLIVYWQYVLFGALVLGACYTIWKFSR